MNDTMPMKNGNSSKISTTTRTDRLKVMDQIDETHYLLTSGRVIHAETGIIGIVNGDVVAGHNVLAVDEWRGEERADLADFMIEQWERFKRGHAAVKKSGHGASSTVGGFVVISDIEDGTAMLGSDGIWFPADVSHERRRTHARTFASIGDAWTFLHEKPEDWWLAAPGGRPRVVQAW